MELAYSSGHTINLRDLEFENKVWKNTLDYLVNESDIYLHHLDTFHFELKESISEPLILESIKELYEFKSAAISLKKKVMIQEEEIPLYIKDFPIDSHHVLFIEHQAIEIEVSEFYHDFKQCMVALRNQYSTMIRTKEV